MEQRGMDILIRMGNGASPEVFTKVAGMRTSSIVHNKEQVDVTNADHVSRWRHLLSGAGVRSLSISCSGVLTDEEVMKDVTTAAHADTFDNWQIVVPGIGTFEGPFQVNVTKGGEHNAEGTYDMTLESAGDIDFALET